MLKFIFILAIMFTTTSCSNSDNTKYIADIVITLEVSGMHCDDCAKNVQNSLLNLKGINMANVSYDSSRAEVKFDSKIVTKNELVNTAITAGTSVKQYQVKVISEVKIPIKDSK